MKLARLLQKRDLWTIAIFRYPRMEDIYDPRKGQIIRAMSESGIRINRSYKSTVADPFLINHLGILYLFYEVKTDHSHGEIWAQSMTPDGTWVSYGCVLRERFHLSYPQVFNYDGAIFMLPEAAQSGKVLLYRSNAMPGGWVFDSVLIDEPLRDPTIIIKDSGEVFVLATTEKHSLRLYYSERLYGRLEDTGIVVTEDMTLSRGAGGIIRMKNATLRPAQDCSYGYGKRIILQDIQDISKYTYNEGPSEFNLDLYKENWMSEGYHHISTTSFCGSVFVAIDGRRKDRIINSFTLGMLKIGDHFKEPNYPPL